MIITKIISTGAEALPPREGKAVRADIILLHCCVVNVKVFYVVLQTQNNTWNIKQTT